MKTINITPEQVTRAKDLYYFDSLNGSITNGKGNIYGAVGEIITFDYFASVTDCEQSNNFDYDLIIDGYRVDVKTKRSNVAPKHYFNCSIPSFNTSQRCDYYFFVRVTDDLKTGYLLGYISKDNFFTNARLNKKGEQDGSGFVFKTDCYNLEAGCLVGF